MAQMIASEMVKPSSPTPSTARKYKLSSIDQVAPSLYIPFIFFYKGDGPKLHDQISRSLKKSLSETLAIFYPLAGTIERNSFVDCNDAGVEIAEARVPARLSHLIQNPKMEELKQLLPEEKSILSIKTSYFDCGGIAVGVCLSHKVGDAASVVAFVNGWAATCRGEVSRIIPPALDQLALRLPPRETEFLSGLGVGYLKEEIVMERFVFDEEKLEKLRKEASTGEVKNPSRVEALSAFIWRSFIDAAKTTTSASSFTASHAVNLRPRAVPPFPNQTFGNCVTAAYAKVSSEEDDGGIGVLVSKLRTAIRGVDGDYINKVEFIEEAVASVTTGEMSEPGNCIFSSWWRFPVYDVDFGWGKPVWVGTATMPVGNLVMFMATPSREGIEAWFNLPLHNHNHFFKSFRANYNRLLNSFC